FLASILRVYALIITKPLPKVNPRDTWSPLYFGRENKLFKIKRYATINLRYLFCQDAVFKKKTKPN
ncbi:MAG TPA: hypothetical protein VKO42_01510, partial [Patescibacteria group bacterium]|nr:hypothetical protein [Patescibacteria group bacterium]